MTFISGPDVVSQNTQTRIESGHLKVDHNVVYQFVSNNVAADSTLAAVFDSSIPDYGQDLATTAGITVWVRSKSGSRKSEDERVLYLVAVDYTNDTEGLPLDENGNFTTNVESIAKTIRIATEQRSVPVDKAKYLLSEKGDGQNWVAPPDLPVGTEGAIVNSALEPQQVTRYRNIKTIQIVDFKRTWDSSWENYENKINNASVTLTQTDVDGVRFSKTYDPFTLLCISVDKEDVFRDGKLWFRRTITLKHDYDTWDHFLLDEGQKQLNVDRTGHDVIVGETTGDTDDEYSLPGPVKLNGEGKAQPTQGTGGQYSAGESFFLVWQLYTEKDLNDLVA